MCNTRMPGQRHKVQGQWTKDPQEKDVSGAHKAACGRLPGRNEQDSHGATLAQEGTYSLCLSVNQRLARRQDPSCMF